MAKINVRSPYYIYDTATNLTSDRIDVYIYTGSLTSLPSTPNYTLISNAIDNKVTFEISELIKDYFDINFNGGYASENYWIYYEIFRSINGGEYVSIGYEKLTSFYGYGYYEDGVNPQNDSKVLQTNRNILKLADTPAVLPLYVDRDINVAYLLNNQLYILGVLVTLMTILSKLDTLLMELMALICLRIEFYEMAVLLRAMYV